MTMKRGAQINVVTNKNAFHDVVFTNIYNKIEAAHQQRQRQQLL